MENNLTTGSAGKNLLFFSLPYLLSYFLQTFYGWAGKEYLLEEVASEAGYMMILSIERQKTWTEKKIKWFQVRFSGFIADKTKKYWTLVIVGYTMQVLAIPALASHSSSEVGFWAFCTTSALCTLPPQQKHEKYLLFLCLLWYSLICMSMLMLMHM